MSALAVVRTGLAPSLPGCNGAATAALCGRLVLDGGVFSIRLADVPEKKDELVEGKYTVESEEGCAIAVR